MANQPRYGLSFSGPRASKRAKVFQPATLHTMDGDMRMHILDISRTGALCHTESPPITGSRVTLECIELQVSASIAWVEGRRFGLAFLRPITDEMVQQFAEARAASNA